MNTCTVNPFNTRESNVKSKEQLTFVDQYKRNQSPNDGPPFGHYL